MRSQVTVDIYHHIYSRYDFIWDFPFCFSLQIRLEGVSPNKMGQFAAVLEVASLDPSISWPRPKASFSLVFFRSSLHESNCLMGRFMKLHRRSSWLMSAGLLVTLWNITRSFCTSQATRTHPLNTFFLLLLGIHLLYFGNNCDYDFVLSI